MARGTNQKFKFSYLMQIMQEKTDDEHAITMPQIMEELEKYEVTAERKSIYADFQDMTDKFGIEIIKEGYDKTQTSPKKQARAYRFALLNKISEKYNVSPLVLDMVCYPFISKEEYLEKHLNIISEEAYTILNRILNEFFELRTGITWFDTLNEVYTQPVLFALKRIFDALKPWEIYSCLAEKKRLYIANYEYLLECIIKFSRIDALTLNQVLEYLSINILTSQQQLSRSADVDDEGVHIICTTVHKSKGLEYGTVILPFTSEDISNIKKAKLEANYCDNSLSYTVLFENEIRERNSNYCENKEIEEQVAEESRILYVALTRAIRNCIWINNLDSVSSISWASLLEGYKRMKHISKMK